MRRALACLLIIAALAAPASAQQRAQGSAKPVPAVASAATPDAGNPILPVPLPFAAERQSRDPNQCRAGCAKAYYFCAASGDDDGCGGQWAQCKSRCTATFTRLGG